MSFEGVWRVEILGAYGWQTIGTAFLLEGQYLAAGADHHTVGSFKEDGDRIDVDLNVTQHGKTQTIFGETKKHINARIEGKLKEPGEITGTLHPPTNRDYDLKLRMTRIEGLD